MTYLAALEKLVFTQLLPYLSLDPGYKETKSNVETLFPKSSAPDSALHHGTCFAESVVRLIDRRHFDKPWIRPNTHIHSDGKVRMENIFSHTIHDFAQMLSADNGRTPYFGYDFLAENLSLYLYKAAEALNLPIYPCPSLDTFRNTLPQDYTEGMLEILRGQALAQHRKFEVTYIACFGNPEQNANTIMLLLKKQLEFAVADQTATDLGRRVLTLLSNRQFRKFIAERFGSGINWSLEQISRVGNSPAWYFVHYGWYGLYSYATNLSYDNVGTLGLRITNMPGWKNFIKTVQA